VAFKGKTECWGSPSLRLEEERELKRIGGSLTISIPKAMVRALGLSLNERVRVLLTDRGLSIVKKR